MQSVQLFRFVRQRQAGDGEEHKDDGGGKEGRYDGGGGCDGRGSGLVVVVIENKVEIGEAEKQAHVKLAHAGQHRMQTSIICTSVN